MINYEELPDKKAAFNKIIKSENALIDELIESQENSKESINAHIEKINSEFANNEVFKNMLLSTVEAASLQIEINSRDLENLRNILDIISERKDTIESDVEQYNTLLSKIQKNVTLASEILQKVSSSFEQLLEISANSETKTLEEPSSNQMQKNNIDDNQIGKHETHREDDLPINLAKIADSNSSDLLCFFPKSNSDILAISTIQTTYKVLFNKENATVFIEEENFNFTLKTMGVQISNSSNVLLISRKSGGFFVVTNMMIDVPSYVNVSKINRNKTFIELTISNSEINIAVDENQISFLEYNDSLGAISKKSEILKQDSKDFYNEDYKKEEDNFESEDNYEDYEDTKEVKKKGRSSSSTKKGYVEDNYYNDNYEDNYDDDYDDYYDEPQTEKPSKSKKAPAQQKKSKDFDEEDDFSDSYSGLNLMEDNDSLIISENDNQVILPYTINEVQKQYKNNKKKYSSVEELIKNEYIVSATNFKNPIRSRFREAYQLIKKREHGHLKEAIDLGFELMFQSNLNPAVIAACKSLRELDIYLDCLDDNELDKFSCFNIVYKVPPTKKSKGKK